MKIEHRQRSDSHLRALGTNLAPPVVPLDVHGSPKELVGSCHALSASRGGLPTGGVLPLSCSESRVIDSVLGGHRLAIDENELRPLVNHHDHWDELPFAIDCAILLEVDLHPAGLFGGSKTPPFVGNYCGNGY